MQTHPAVLIGGPPHSGKSVLLYTLSQALRNCGVDHYALRSCPDGEGDFSQEATPETVRAIRIKGGWSPEWVSQICRDIHNRHMPLLVDVGGRPTLDQERIFDECTHAILLTKDEASHEGWSERITRHGLPLLADLTSRLGGESTVQWNGLLLRGIVTNLDRHKHVANPVVDALAGLLAQLFTAGQNDLRQRHLKMAPRDVEMVVDLDRLAVTLGMAQPGAKVTWMPEHLPILLDYLPAATPLATYGRGANWMHAALARLAFPEPYFSFDVRLGWVQAQRLTLGVLQDDARLKFENASDDAWSHVRGVLPPSQYVDISELPEVIAPDVAPEAGVILSGKLPYWLYTSLAVAYAAAPWLAVYQPQLRGAVIVYSRTGGRSVGDVAPVAVENEETPL